MTDAISAGKRLAGTGAIPSGSGPTEAAGPPPIDNRELQEHLWALFGRPEEPRLSRADTALLCVDLQYVDAHPEHGLGAKAARLGLGGFLEPYFEEVRTVVVPNVQRLQEAFRARGMEVVHVRVAANTADGRDATRRYVAMGLRTPRDTREAQFLPEVAPCGDELTFNKLTSSAFNSTVIDRLLRNMGIRNLVIVGVVTNGCVESTTRSAAELDYGTIVVSDATAAMAPQLHEHALLSMGYKDAAIRTTDEVLGLLEAI
jgi:nicotinamidase-related amidase